MIASDDVRRVTFERIMRGYRCEDVDDYLKQVADTMDALSQENADLQNKVRILGQRIDQYRSEEDTLRTTMINAQRMGENVIKEAKQKAAETIRAANIKADDREQRARDEVELAQQEIVTLKHEANAFKKTLLDKYRVHIEMLSKLPDYEENSDIAEQENAEIDYPEVDQSEAIAEETQAPEAVENEPLAPIAEATSLADEPQSETRVDTVEFALAPKAEGDDAQEDEMTDADEPEALSREQQVSALFGSGADSFGVPASTDTIRGKSAPKGKSKSKAKAAQADSLPPAFDSFEGVDFES